VIRTSDIANALGQRLLTLDPALPVAWPNKDLPAGTAHPYLIFDLAPVSRTDDTTTADAPITRGFVQVAVMTKINSFASQGMSIAEDVAALFPNGLKLTITGGTLETGQAEVQDDGYPDGPHWRTPVRIPYMAY